MFFKKPFNVLLDIFFTSFLYMYNFITVRALEKARATGNYMDAHELGLGIKSAEDSSHDTDSSDGEGTTRRVKKLKINSVNV